MTTNQIVNKLIYNRFPFTDIKRCMRCSKKYIVIDHTSDANYEIGGILCKDCYTMIKRNKNIPFSIIETLELS